MNRANFFITCFVSIQFAFLIFHSRDVSAQIKVSKIAGPEFLTGKKGIVYHLPRTVVHINVWISKTQQFAGPLSEYAADYLGIDEVATKNTVNYDIVDAAISTSIEPDPGQVYLIEKEDKASSEVWISFGKQAPVMTMEKFDKTMAPQGFVQWNNDLFITAEENLLYRKYSESPSREVVDTVIRRFSIDTLIIEDVSYRYSMVEFSDKEKAQEAAARIRQIERDQYNLLIGYQETAYSRDVLQFMLDELEKQRQEYLKLFVGVSVKETLNFEYQLVPEALNETGTYTLAGFSETMGITETEGQSAIAVKFIAKDQILTANTPIDNQPAMGLAYRLLQPVQAIVTFQDKELTSRRIDVLQLGPVLTLPPAFKRVEFDMETGALRSVVLE